MQALDLFIKKRIKETRRRVTAVRLASDMLFGLVIGMAGAAVIMVVSLFVPMYYAPVFAVAVIGLGLLSGGVLTLIRRPDMKRAALLLDAKGFQERVTTSYERAGESDTFSMLLKEDTKKRLTGFSIKGAFPYKISVKQIVIFCGLAVIIAVAGLIDAPARKQAREQHAIAMQVMEKAEDLAEALSKLEKQEELSKEDMSEIKEMLSDAKEELKEAESAEDIEKAEERLEKKLEQKVKDLASENKKEAAKALMDLAMDMNPELTDEQKKEISQMMTELDTLSDELSEALEKAEEGTLSEEELEELKAKLAEAAKKLSDEELQAALSQAASSMSAEDLENALAALSSAQSDLMAAALDADGSLSVAGLGQSGQGFSGSGGAQGSSGNGNSAGSGGSGVTGADGAGGGWYQGSNQGAESSETYDGDYVSVPEDYQDNENLTGTPVDGESYTQQGGPSVTWSGIKMDYQQVIADYQNKAYERIEGGDYPAAVQDAIKNYFENLNK